MQVIGRCSVLLQVYLHVNSVHIIALISFEVSGKLANVLCLPLSESLLAECLVIYQLSATWATQTPFFFFYMSKSRFQSGVNQFYAVTNCCNHEIIASINTALDLTRPLSHLIVSSVIKLLLDTVSLYVSSLVGGCHRLCYHLAVCLVTSQSMMA